MSRRREVKGVCADCGFRRAVIAAQRARNPRADKGTSGRRTRRRRRRSGSDGDGRGDGEGLRLCGWKSEGDGVRALSCHRRRPGFGALAFESRADDIPKGRLTTSTQVYVHA